MPKFEHYNPTTQKWSICHATKRPCPFPTRPYVPKSSSSAVPNVKTLYREGAVLLGLAKVKLPGLLSGSSENFKNELAKHTELSENQQNVLASLVWEPGQIPDDMIASIQSNHKLGESLREQHFKNKSLKGYKVRLVGDDKKYAPADIVITNPAGEESLFSLKENSQILHNGSVVHLLRNLSGNDNLLDRRDSNIFHRFAPEEHDAALMYMLRSLPEDKKLLVSGVTGFQDFRKMLSPEERREIRYLLREGSNSDVVFKQKKQQYNAKVAEVLRSHVTTETLAKASPSMLLNAVEGKGYHYASVDSNGKLVHAYVPEASEVDKKLQIVGVYFRAGQQLDMFLVLKNVDTGKETKLQTEFRYSHGQFSGVEAKTKWHSGASLTELLSF